MSNEPEPLILIVTGSRKWTDADTIRRQMRTYAIRANGEGRLVILRHGGCPTGADAIADEVARYYRWPVQVYTADWSKHGNKAGPIRNSAMVAAEPKADRCLGFPMAGSRGTWDCLRKAQDAGIPVRVVGGEE